MTGKHNNDNQSLYIHQLSFSDTTSSIIESIYNLPISLHDFGAIIIKQQHILLFGGISDFYTSMDDIYYLDISTFKICKSTIKIPFGGSIHALLKYNEVHLFGEKGQHYTININVIIDGTVWCTFYLHFI